VFARLPIPHRAGIDSQSLCHLPLRKAEFSAGRDEAFRERTGRRSRIVAEEPNDGRHVADNGRGCVAFPVRNRSCVDLYLLGNLLLKEFQVQTAGADMAA